MSDKKITGVLVGGISLSLSGTIYLRARYYDSSLGRFTQQDGWEFAKPEDPLSLNLYTYCWNNPVKFMDPYGNAPGDLFDTSDEAAIDFAMEYNQQSIEEGKEYGSAIFFQDCINCAYTWKV